jgi:hypothetical protein
MIKRKLLIASIVTCTLLIMVGISLNSGTVPQTPEIIMAIADEWVVWEKQFHLGEADRAERLAMQRLSPREMRQRILEAVHEQHQVEKQVRVITEAETRAWFTAHQNELRLPMRYRVSHLFLSRHHPQYSDRQSEMQSIHLKLRRGADFAKLAFQYSEDARSKQHGGDLGWFSATRMPADFMAHVEKLRVGQLSAPVQTKLGWHILRLLERRESRPVTFEEARAEIEALLDLESRVRVISSPSSRWMVDSR